jgi:hypothetical protein
VEGVDEPHDGSEVDRLFNVKVEPIERELLDEVSQWLIEGVKLY